MALALAQTVAFGGTAAAANTVATGAGATGAANLVSVPTNGNLLFQLVQISDNATTITTPTGYALVTAIVREGTASIAAYTKVCDGTDGTSASINYGNAANAMILYGEIGGGINATPLEAAFTNTAINAGSLSLAVTAAASTVDGTEMICLAGGAIGKPTWSAPLDGLTINQNGQSTGGTGTTGASLFFASKTLSGSNEQSSVGATLSVSRNWGAVVFAVRAASVAPPSAGATSSVFSVAFADTWVVEFGRPAR